MKKTLVSTPFDVARLFAMEVEGEKKIDLFTARFGGEIKGEFEKKKFYISFYPDEAALISISDGTGEVPEELITFLNKIMGADEPIAKYNLTYPGKVTVATVEWDIKDPEARIKSLVAGTAYSAGGRTDNLVLFGNRKIEDYAKKAQTRVR